MGWLVRGSQNAPLVGFPGLRYEIYVWVSSSSFCQAFDDAFGVFCCSLVQRLAGNVYIMTSDIIRFLDELVLA